MGDRERERLAEESLARAFPVEAGRPEAMREAARRVRLLEQLSEVTRTMEDPHTIVVAAMDLLRRALDADRCAYGDLETDEDHFVFSGCAVREGVAEVHGRFPVSGFGAEALPVLRSGAPYVVADLAATRGVDPDVKRGTAIRGLVAVPVYKGGRFVAGTGVHTLAPRTWSEGDVALVRAVTERLWDAIERARAERALRASEARYRSLVDGQSEMLCRFRRDGTIVFVNRAYAAARGTTPEELEGRDFWGFIPASEHAEILAMMDGLRPEAPEVRIENRFLTEAGERWTLWSNRAITFDASGRWVEAQSSGLDITDRKRVEEALREADRRKDEFLAMLAHELRNPLAPIRTAAEVLARIGLSDPRQRRACEAIERQTLVMSRLVDDLLDVARITQGKVRVVREPVDVAKVVATAVETSRHLLEARGQTLEVSAPSGEAMVDGDATRLVQVVGNLLHNASKYTHDGGHVRIETRVADGQVHITVQDDGRGIAAEVLPTIFDLFVQADRSLDRPHGGLGVGLTLVRKLVEMHGGRVEARSDGIGKGAAMVVSLPLLARAPAAPRGPASTSQAVRGMRVLVVEDNEDAAEVLGMMLELAGHEVRVARDGEEGFVAATSSPPEVVLCDLGLPKLDGFELASRLRARRDLDGTWLVAVSGYGREEDRARARDVGFDHHLVKPLAPRALDELLRKLSGERR